MSRDSVGHTFKLAGMVCVVCSVIVAGAAVGWRSKQEKNRREDMQKNVLSAAGIEIGDQTIASAFEPIDVRIVNLATGEFATSEDDERLVVETYNPRAAAKDPTFNVQIPSDQDPGGIRQREKFAIVYLVTNGKEGSERKIEQIVLPIYGKGLWSTLYGFISLDADLITIRGLTFYEHKETPGLGGEVDNKDWKKIWTGETATGVKQAYDAEGQVMIRVLKGKVAPGDPAKQYKVDGLAGATITTRGVDGMLRYWLGKNGFRPFLDKLRESGSLAAGGSSDG